jgi:acetyltransferase-like isoleucine patch superfamily enzyme
MLNNLKIWFRAFPLKSKTSTSKLITAGRETYGLEHIHVHAWNQENRLKVGSFTSIAVNLHVYLGGNHNLERISTFPFGAKEHALMIGPRDGHPVSNGDVIIGNDVWVGSCVTIMSGVEIGDGAVIAANSHVVKNVAPYEIVGGNPARHIRFRFNNQIIEKLLEIKWWDWDLNLIMSERDFLTSIPDIEQLREKLT